MTRWFTSGDTGALAVPRTEFTSVELGSMNAILQFARDPSNHDLELMHCIDADGIRLIDQNTGRKSVELTDPMRAAAASEAVRFWHNHPSQDSLSSYDWRLAARENAEVLAVNESGSVFVGRIADRRFRLAW